LVDVGVSGGIHSVWQSWGDCLHAIGIDVLEQEIERLRHQESNPNVQYEAVRLTSGAAQPATAAGCRSNYNLHRSSAYMATKLRDLLETNQALPAVSDYVAAWREVAFAPEVERPREANYSNLPDPLRDPFYHYYQRLFERSIGLQEPVLTSHTATLDEILDRKGFVMPDLIKIDTDGWELDILRGGQRALSRCLAVEVEVQFHGLTADDANVFSEIDRLLRRAGFNLMKLTPYSYSRSALPRPFLYPELPAQTKGGPIQWADALYVRDLILQPPVDLDLGERDRRVQIAALILDAYELEDAAAEVIVAYGNSFCGRADELLDALAKKLYGPDATYANSIEGFLRGTASYRCA
jgi:FkbM family methyltransferase